MAALARALLRVLLIAWGLFFVGTGVATLAFPEVLHSENPDPPSPAANLVFAALFTGYGAFLMLPPRTLATHRWLRRYTLGAGITLLGYAVLARTAWTARDAGTIVLLVALPTALQLLLLRHAHSRVHSRVHTRDPAPHS